MTGLWSLSAICSMYATVDCSIAARAAISIGTTLHESSPAGLRDWPCAEAQD